MFSVRNSNAHNLRSNNCKLYIDKPETDVMKKFFSYLELHVFARNNGYESRICESLTVSFCRLFACKKRKGLIVN